jgi:hypothetical protein
MTRFHNRNGVKIPFTPEEETARDAEEQAWADKAPERELKAFYDKRKSEYPTIEELVVALYDPEDKAEIDRRRAEVKNKYPKGDS